MVDLLCSSNRISDLSLHLQTVNLFGVVSNLMKNNKHLFISHSEKSLDFGDSEFCFMASIVTKEVSGAEFYYVNILITDISTLVSQPFEFAAVDLEVAIEFLVESLKIFGIFDPKILSFDDYYDQEFISSTVMKWTDV